ncbi:MAG TPA: choice-of-anchor D domain-containing protein [Usitatibacter sp.]|nr:choice-of-anchor D domain-containing protein [Usitatibacter sp.]
MAAQAVTFTVTSNADSGTGTLRDAINFFSDSCTGADVITFSGPFTIDLATDLPQINCGGLNIKGPGKSDGSVAPVTITSSTRGAYNGLVSFASPMLTAQGLAVHGFNGTGILGQFNTVENIVFGNGTGIEDSTGSVVGHNRVFSNDIGIIDYGGLITRNSVYDNSTGIEVEYANNSSITNNFIGLDETGARHPGNDTGIYLYSANFVSITGNVISNNDTGISTYNDGATVIGRNLIGTDASGSAPLGNFLGIAAQYSYGGAITGNTISSNSDFGIDMSNTGVMLVDGNMIGTDSAKSANLPNGSGVRDSCGDSNQISNNYIGTSGGHAIDLEGVSGGGPAGTVVGNKIGVKGDGVTPLGNNAYGIFLGSGCSNNSNFTITGNNIRNSSADGIFIGFSYGGQISGNTITGNSGYGIDIVAFGSGNQMLDNKNYGNANSLSGVARKNTNLGSPGAPRANDAGDGDSGPNDGQNWPNIDSVLQDLPHSQTKVNFTLDATPGTYTIQVFANPSGSHVPGGEALAATLNGFSVSGPTSGTIAVTGFTLDHFSLTATNESLNDTSEYSPVIDAQPTPALTVSPTSVDFGSVTFGTSSAPRTIQVHSAGGAPLTLQSVADSCVSYGGSLCYGGDFTCTTTCAPGTLNPGQGCDVTATYHPSTTGQPATGQFCVSTDAGNQIVSLAGIGVPPPVANISPSSFDFGPILVRSTSDTQGFNVINTQSSSVGIGTPVTTNADFPIVSTDCSFFIAAASHCTVNVAFNPSTVGPINGQLVVPANLGDVIVQPHGVLAAAAFSYGGPPPATASLNGTGTVIATLSMPDAVDFGAHLTGSPPDTRNVVLTAGGNSTVNISSITASGPFSLTNGCPSALGPGTSCSVQLGFAENALGSYSGTLTVVTDAVGGTRTIPVTARTVAIAAPHISVSPKTIGFGNRMMGTQSDSQRITVTSDGTDTAALQAIATTGPDFVITATTCGGTLAPGESCRADVAFRPAGFGSRPGQQVVVGSNSPDSPAVVGLGGTGCRPFNAATARLGDSGCLP